MARSLFIIEAIPQLKDVFQTLRLLFHHQPLKPPRYRAQAEGQKESLPNTKKRKQNRT